MPYEDVPGRLAAGEAVPRSEIIGYFGPDQDIKITLGLRILEMAFIMSRSYSGDTILYGLTTLGMTVRSDLITRLEGECPECP